MRSSRRPGDVEDMRIVDSYVQAKAGWCSGIWIAGDVLAVKDNSGGRGRDGWENTENSGSLRRRGGGVGGQAVTCTRHQGVRSR